MHEYEVRPRKEMEAQNQSKKKSPLVVTIAAIIGAVIGSVLVQQYFNQPPRIESALVGATAEINKNLPMMVDKETRLDTTMAAPRKTIIYRYTLVNQSSSGVQKDALIKAIKSRWPTIVANYRTNDSMKNFRDMGVTMKYQYSDRNGVFIAEIAVSPKDF